MKRKALNAALVWKHFEDLAVPRLGLSLMDRAAYSHLLRHSRLEGKQQVRFTISWLSRGIRMSLGASRDSVRRLAAVGALRVLERGRSGHMVEVRLPGEIPAVTLKASPNGYGKRLTKPDLERIDFLRGRALRASIHQREGGRCFYCLRSLRQHQRCLDHVTPRCRSGRNSYRNLVSSCLECNSEKGEWPAEEHVLRLYREHRLTAAEFRQRRDALRALVGGKLRPSLPENGSVAILPFR